MSQRYSDVSGEDVVDALSFFDGWEDRYKYIIDLGKELPEFPSAYEADENLIRGCQSQVWMTYENKGGVLYFAANSDAFIVKGLLAVVLAAFNGKTPSEIQAFEIEQYFERLDLLGHLSATRGNGLRAMVQKIQSIAQSESL